MISYLVKIDSQDWNHGKTMLLLDFYLALQDWKVAWNKFLYVIVELYGNTLKASPKKTSMQFS